MSKAKFEFIHKELNEVDMQNLIPKFEQTINAQYKSINGLMIMRKGFVVYEKYFNGYKQNDNHIIASVTKSFTSALIGIAIDKGLIKSVNEKVVDFFPNYPTDFRDIVKRSITIKQLLTMTAPVPWKYDPLDRLRRQKDWAKYVLDQYSGNQAIGRFKYNTAGTHLLSAIITKATGMCAREFANKHLFTAIGIEPIADHKQVGFSLNDVFSNKNSGWIKDPQGHNTGGWGLNLSVRDMARFGLLYLNNGKWLNKQVISKSWIKESTAMNENKYGYLWWLIDEDNIKGYMAAGSGGNHIFCIPDKDLVVVIASKITMKSKDRLPLLVDCVLPAVLS
ncbi:serine hydrolase [Clostridium sp. 'deep sea']|uniref:serine hydrolase domain-containing protein n=1 Tax=Clostridium sp. 'deep sea' TaxID=2779445 RepID=UPI0018966A42|nr:serine hydrolase [Clostridium sp. 'deep sea']QOR35764.1 serine hydrolase [Clostridium sp. 'deep sea']